MQMLGVNSSNEVVGVVAVIVTEVAAIPAYCYWTAFHSVALLKTTQSRVQDSGGVHPSAHSARPRRSQ